MISAQQISAALQDYNSLCFFWLTYKLASHLIVKSLGLASIILSFLVQTHIAILKLGLL